MISTKLHQNDAKIARVTISLDAEVYKKVKDLSHQMGLRPSSWMAMIVSAQINDVHVEIHRGEGE